MKMIISPAKKMNVNTEELYTGMPVFMHNTEEIMEWMQKLSYEEVKALWKCSDKIAEENFEK